MKPLPTPPKTGYRKHRAGQKMLSLRKDAVDDLKKVQAELLRASGQKWPYWRVIVYGCSLIRWSLDHHGGKIPLHRTTKEDDACL